MSDLHDSAVQAMENAIRADGWTSWVAESATKQGLPALADHITGDDRGAWTRTVLRAMGGPGGQVANAIASDVVDAIAAELRGEAVESRHG